MKTLARQVIEKQSDLEQDLVQFYAELLNETGEDHERDTTTIIWNIPKLVTIEHNAMLRSPIK